MIEHFLLPSSFLFLDLLNMSICAGWVILAVLILRLILKKAPGWFRMGLWGLVAVRLILPFSFESKLSLVPSSAVLGSDLISSSTPQIFSGIPAVDTLVNPLITQTFAPEPGASMNPLQVWIPFFVLLWIIGAAAMIVYMFTSYGRLRRKVSDAVLEEGCYVSEAVVSPFVLGIRDPKIYLPANILIFEKEHVLAHERAHIRRKDHWWKPLGFLLLAIHWFNPLVWVAYALFCRDLEFACDEAVIKSLDPSQRADYSQALLNCCAQRNRISACPLAFGEVGVKERIKSVLSYKKPAFWILATAVVAVAVTCLCLLTNPARVIPTSPIGEDFRNPDYVLAWVGGSVSNPMPVSREAHAAIIPMIFDHKYTLLKEVPFPDLSSAKTKEEKFQMYWDYNRTFPDGVAFQESDFETAFHIQFSYGPTEEWWTFYNKGIRRGVRKSGNDVVSYWYRMDVPFYLEVLDWYKNMVLPSPEDLLNRTY